MDTIAIKEAIQSLETEETTPESVSELAALYTVYKGLTEKSVDPVESELDDILPYYRKYRDIKRRYQLNQAIDSEVIHGIKDVCQELKEFIDLLYYSTDMNKERLCLKKLIKELAERYKD